MGTKNSSKKSKGAVDQKIKSVKQEKKIITDEIIMQPIKDPSFKDPSITDPIRDPSITGPIIDDPIIDKPIKDPNHNGLVPGFNQDPHFFVVPGEGSNDSTTGTTEEQKPSHNTRPNSVMKTSSSLIPIKGISSKMQSKLAAKRIFDVPTLLSRCRNQAKRDKLAAELGISSDYVNSWVKQGDLWRVEGMTTDMAYMLVEVGVRNVSDLSRVDPDKAYPILKSISLTHPDFVLMTKDELSNLISVAEFMSDSVVDLNILKSSLLKTLNSQTGIIEPQRIDKIIYGARKSSNGYGFTDEEPTYLFRSAERNAEIELAEKLSAAWKDLFEFDCTLPLPRIISGTVLKRSVVSNSQPKPFEGVKVEIDGVVSPAEDKTEAVENPSCITDATGHFIITLPERYSFKETIKIIISNNRGRQEFIKNSTDVINALEETELVNALQEVLAKRIAYRTAHILSTSDQSNNINLDNARKDFDEAINELTSDDYKLKKKLDQLGISDEVGLLRSAPISPDDEYFDKTIQKVFNIILSKATLEAKLEGIDSTDNDDCFVVTTEVFTGERTDLQKALPSVKLMGDDENPVMLSTDTAPSRMFTYSMLQRLIEPELSKDKKTFDRVKLNQPVDVGAFKENLYTNPDKYPQMSTLGLGYQLNMHQAWVPDGFALGELLYSLILAPGEEQRLIVRENKQAYQITDTAQGTDLVTEDYENNQTDDTSAVYDYAVAQLMDASSSFKSKSSSWGIGGSASGGYGGYFSLGLTGSYSKSSSSGSSSARQSNSHNEASSAAQRFQQSIKTSSNRLAQAKRVSMSIATSEVSDSVATKIIANHNHSHAMTIQYWEVMRRYRLETAIDSVDLVLFVPIKPIDFLGSASFIYLEEDFQKFTKTSLTNRYAALIKYANYLERALPWKYRTGLNLIRSYAATSNWVPESSDTNEKTVTLEFQGNYLSFDDLTATLYLKNGRGSIGGEISYVRTPIDDLGHIITRDGLKSAIRDHRNKKGNVKVTVTFNIPGSFVKDDISSIRIYHSFDPLNYTLQLDPANDFSSAQYEAWLNYLDKEWDFAKDDKSSSKDLRRMAHYKELLPEAFTDPEVYFTASVLKSLGLPSIHSVNVKITEGKDTTNSGDSNNNGGLLSFALSSSTIANSVYITVLSSEKTLRRSEFQKMEETFHHIVTDTLRYSQVIWSALSSDERAMLFDQYTIDMDFSTLRKVDENSQAQASNNPKEYIPIPLLNCVNIRKVLGFYGNCMLLPFTFPKELADILGRTAAEVQDQLYRYHTNSFRASTTVISLPTKGMIGEAVLGQTNVSEIIDLTRFWNWQDSPIDKMELDSSYLNGTDYLSGKTTKDISSLGLEGVSPTTPVTAADLVTALVNKQTPTFNNLTGQDQLADIIKKNTESASTGRDNIINKTSEMVNKYMELSQKQMQAETNANKEIELQKIKKGKKESGDKETDTNGDGDGGGDGGDSHPHDLDEHESEVGGEGNPEEMYETENATVSIDSITNAFTKMKEFAESNPDASPIEFLSQIYNIVMNQDDMADEAKSLLADGNSISDVVSSIKNIGHNE